MEPGSVRADNESVTARDLAIFLDDAGARDVVALDISGHSTFADTFVIAGAASQGQLSGFYRRTEEFLRERGLAPRNHRKRDDESGWLLLDYGALIVHLMLDEIRHFYELEKLWYDSETLWKRENEP